MQVFATKAGIIKTTNDIQGVVVKGIGSDYDWTFFQNYLVEGKTFTVNDTSRTNQVLVSRYLAKLLQLKTGDNFLMYFIEDTSKIRNSLASATRYRRFTISGIYETGLEEFDRMFVIADIGHVQRLNNWSTNQVSGFEVFVNDFDKLDVARKELLRIAGNSFQSDGTKLMVLSIKEKYVQIFDWLQLIDMNVWIILFIMLLVAVINMVSNLLILILDRTNMIGTLKALGSPSFSLMKVFLYQGGFLILRGLLWGNIIAIGLCMLQKYTGLIHLNQATYFISTVPININWVYFLLINLGTILLTLLVLLVPAAIIFRISPTRTIRFN
jgi:lipoprotein-releasing system permease protein